MGSQTPEYVTEADVSWHAMRAQGSGGQNVNKVSSAVHLRFDVPASSLPEAVKERLLALNDQRITTEGVVVIKAQSYRTQEQNLQDGLLRLNQLLASVWQAPKKRRATRPTLAAKKRRLEGKTRRADVKRNRGKIRLD
ncbi:alternative ribosome rescue aminoacyl-tRNA hydrolase ArfB [Pseudomaricurvus sp. HS19]|uniref:alternative ribosome rescue aminoacyl-tRNA hydrolase ArfB n=1 Tax=Pseudomaricurvus sp. HS19 TaxID=2692626 RepID=UPI003519E2E6